MADSTHNSIASCRRSKIKTVKIVYRQESDGMWLGHLEAYPDYMTQGTTLDELKGNLKDILADLPARASRETNELLAKHIIKMLAP